MDPGQRKQAVRLYEPAHAHFKKMVPILRNGALAGPVQLQHDCFWFRPAYPWRKGSPAKPHEVIDHYCIVHYWHPMVSDAALRLSAVRHHHRHHHCMQAQFHGFPGMPDKLCCPGCKQSGGVESTGLMSSLRLIQSTHLFPGGKQGNLYAFGMNYKHANCPKPLGMHIDTQLHHVCIIVLCL